MNVDKLNAKCQVLMEIAAALEPIYLSATSREQKDFIETLVGAAIWYLPNSKQLWTGYISVKAWEALENRELSLGQLSQDHCTVRKKAAIEIITNQNNVRTSLESLVDAYKTKYGLFNYVLKRENKTLVSASRKRPENPYQEAGIELIKLTPADCDTI